MRNHRDPKCCDSCDAPHDGALPQCAGVNCEMRVCHRCRSAEWLCPECSRESARPTPTFAAELFDTAVLLLSGATVAGEVLPVVGEEKR